jgi:hypothetical protein
MAWHDINGDPTDFGWFLSYFDCGEDISSIGQFTVSNLFYGSTSYIDSRVCFSQKIALSDSFESCSIHFIVGMNSQGSVANHKVKFTYSLHVTRQCY